MIFGLVKDFADALEAMPPEHPRYRIVKLLDEGVRRDVHFIYRHPTTFFQSMWNTCWWYDSTDSISHYEPSESSEAQPSAIEVAHLATYRRTESPLPQLGGEGTKSRSIAWPLLPTVGK